MRVSGESKGETYVAVATVVVDSVAVVVVSSVKTTMLVAVDVKVDVGRMYLEQKELASALRGLEINSQ